MLVYKIDVIAALKQRGFSSTAILKHNFLSQSSMQKIRSGEVVGNKVLDQLCGLLDMQPGDIIEYKK